MKGSLRERSPGVWELRVYTGRDPVTGKERAVSRTFRGGKREASTALSKLVGELDDPAARRRAAPARITLSALIGERLASWEGSATTRATYQSMLTKHIAPTVGRLAVGDVDTRMLDHFYRWLSDEHGLSASTIKGIHSLIRGSLRQATVWGYIAVNPAVEARPRGPQRSDIQLPDGELVADAIASIAARDPEFGCFVRLAAATGARRGELCGLQWADVDLDRGVLRIDAAVIATTASGVLRQHTKTHTKRTVALDPDTVDVLRAHRRAMTERASAADTVLTDRSYVFSHSAAGLTPWRPDNVSTKWSRLRDRVGLAGVRLHDLRHLQATTLLRAGVPVKNVSRRLGHRDAATTLNVYAQFLEDADRESALVMGHALGATRGGLPQAADASR